MAIADALGKCDSFISRHVGTVMEFDFSGANSRRRVSLSLCHRANHLLCERMMMLMLTSIYLVFTPFGLIFSKSFYAKSYDRYC